MISREMGISFLSIDEALPLLTSAYRTDRLVPFVGSGLSMPACRSWSNLVLETLKQVRLTPDEAFSQSEVPRDVITRQADEAMRLLRAMPRQEFVKLLAASLYADREIIPPNSLALAGIRWPLIISTNYDDVLLRAFEQARNSDSEPSPQVKGRDASDCHAVLRSLDIPSSPILWAIQGYLHDRAERDGQDLVAQLVLSHKQYQDAINNNPLFRRAFAEVFRRRTLLFIGSGILEDYLVNLFGEVVAQHGPPPRRHYAFLRRDQLLRLNARFLTDRLGIVPVLFDHYPEIAVALSDLASAVTTAGKDNPSPLKGTHFAAVPASLGFDLVTPRRPCPMSVVIESARLERVTPRDPYDVPPATLMAISVGRTSDGALMPGPMAKGVLGPEASEILQADFRRLHEGGCVFVSERWPVLAVAARDETGVFDLGLISQAVGECIQVAEQRGASRLRIGLLSGGKAAPWHPVFSLIQMLAGIRDLCHLPRSEAPQCPEIEEVRVSLVDPRAWYPVVSGQVPVAELLSSGLNTIFVCLQSDAGSDLFTYVTPQSGSSLESIQRYFNLDRHDWDIDVSPAHSDEPSEQPYSRPISSYSTIRIRFRSAREELHDK